MITSVENLKKMAADKDCIKVATALFQAVAYEQTVREIIQPKQEEVVRFFRFKVDSEKKKTLSRYKLQEYIEKASDMYLASDEDFNLYMAEMDKFHREQGFKKPSAEYCPLLMAESLTRKTRVQVADFLEPYTGISYDMVSGSLENYRKYFDLIMHIFAPYIKA
jgi:hypothetical protein